MTTLAYDPRPSALPQRRPVARRVLLRRADAAHWALAAFLYLFFALFLVWPILQIVVTGFTARAGSSSFTLEYVRLIFADRVLVAGLLNATLVAVLVTLLSLAIALPLAILGVRYEFPGRAMLSGLLLVPLVLPPFVGALGIRLVLGRFGPLTQIVGWFGIGGETGIDWLGKYRLLGVVLVEALHLYPIMLLNLQAALANIDPAMEQAAANLGAGRWTVLRKITLPLIRPGLFAGSTLVLIWSFTELGTPLLFDYYTITPVQVYKLITDVADNPVPYALVVVMLLASALLYVVGKVLLGRGFDAATTKASVAGGAKRLHGWRAVAAAAPFIIVFLLAVVPHVSVVLTSVSEPGAWYKSVLPRAFTLGHYRRALLDDLALPSVAWSIRYATMATLVALVVGLIAAVVIVRSRIPGRGVIDALAMLPLAVPGVVLAFGYLSVSVWFRRHFPAATEFSATRRGPLFWLNVEQWPVAVLVIAYAARRLPYVVRSAVAGLQQTPRDLELAAGNLGASRFTVLRRITVPLILANLLAGALLAFAFAMLEVSDSIILAQRMAYFPVTKAIIELFQGLGDGIYVASALGVWAMVLLTLTILSANSLLGKKIGAIFRV